MTYQFQRHSGKNDCTDLWVIKPTNQVSPSSGFSGSSFNNKFFWDKCVLLSVIGAARSKVGGQGQTLMLAGLVIKNIIGHVSANDTPGKTDRQNCSLNWTICSCDHEISILYSNLLMKCSRQIGGLSLKYLKHNYCT